MTEIEVDTLYAIVRASLANGGMVSTCQELAQLLHMKQSDGGIPPAKARLVNERLLRLNGKHHFLHKKRKDNRSTRSWYLNTETFGTEPETAVYFAALVDVCTPPSNDKIHKADFHEAMTV